MTGKRLAVAFGSMIIVAVLVAGVATGAFSALARSGLYATGLWAHNGASTLPPGALEPSNQATPRTPSPSASATPAPHLPRAVLSGAKPGPIDGAALRSRIRSVSVKGATNYSGTVIEVGSGRVLFAHQADRARIPASTMKLLTSTAALSILGPEHTFATTVVAPKRGRIILVGGGDPYLTKRTVNRYPKRSSITQLAAETATALKKKKVSSVRLGYDTSLFRGPAWNPVWPGFYADQVSKTSALWVDEGRVNGGSPGPRVSDPAGQAVSVYAAALRRHGIRVDVGGAERAARNATPIASVSSMPLERIVEKLLMESDNDAAEVVFRQAAVGSGLPGTIENGKRAVRARLIKLGMWDSGTVINDGSGLARQTKVPADTMAKVLRVASEEKHPELRGVITGLPVAGVEGSLRGRYSDDQSLAGRGVVRGKTGTLSGVHSRAGVLRTRSGALLAYAFLFNNPKSDWDSIVWMDRVTSALSTCGCR